MRSTLGATVLVSVIAVAVTACGAGPSDRPGVATRQNGGTGPATSVTAPPDAGVPALQTPRSDLAWADCTRPTLDSAGLAPGPAGLVIECAQFTPPVDAGGSIIGSTTVGALRARLPQTPRDAAPLVLTSGVDRASGNTLAAVAVGAPAVVAAHPIVAVDRRGVGTSGALNCIPADVRRGLDDNGQSSATGQPAADGRPATNAPDQIDALAALSNLATTACKDYLQPEELTYDAGHAADDLDQLRKQWQVDRIGLIGVGNGAVVATGYAAKYPDHLARLLLDSPWPTTADQATRVEQQVQGAEAALSAFAQRCVSLQCSLGADPKAAVVDLMRRASTNQLPGVSGGTLTSAILGFLGSPRADQATRTPVLADALSAAGRGDTNALKQLITRASAEIGTDGQFVAGCSDIQRRAPLQQAHELRKTWGGRYPAFGDQAAVDLVTCTSWPTMNPVETPVRLKGLPILVLSGVADPVSGNGGLSSVTGVFDAAGAKTSVVTWQGFGYSVLTHSGCAAGHVVKYLGDGALARNGSACPA